VKQKKASGVGGQAVIEGVMMRTRDYFVVAVRKPDNTIKIRSKKWQTVFPKILKKPFLRGALILFESMFGGIEALTYSFNESVPDEEKENLSSAGIIGSIFVAFLFAATLFVALPHLSAYLLENSFTGSSESRSILFHALDGIIKIAIFTLYILLISRIEDVKRIFAYHGAEHKAIHTYEEKELLSPENAKKFTTLHRRCGTSFIVTVLAISILLFTTVFAFIPRLSDSGFINTILYLPIKIALIFPIGGISFELQRAASRHQDNIFLRALSAPGLWFQHITTKEPDRDTLEIGLASLLQALYLQKNNISIPKEGVEEVFNDFDEFSALIKLS